MKKKWAVVLAAIVMLLAMAIQTVEPIVYAAQSISSSQTVEGNEKTGSQTSSATASTEDEAVTGSSTSSSEATESSAVTDSTTPGTNTASSSSTTEEANTSSSSSSKKEDESSSSKDDSDEKDEGPSLSEVLASVPLGRTVGKTTTADELTNYVNIPPVYNTDEKGTYPTNSWSPSDQTDVINHQGHTGNSTNDRIGKVKEGVNKFVDAISNSGMADQINLGYLGYSSDAPYNGSNSQGLIKLDDFNNVKDAIKNFTPNQASGATFTQKALREGAAQLTANNGHKKVLVLLTDGVPTYSYEVTEAKADGNGLVYGTKFSSQREGRGNTSYLGDDFTNWTAPYTASGLPIESTFAATIGEAKRIIDEGIQIHGLGIQLGADSFTTGSGWWTQTHTYKTKDEVEKLMRQMVSTDNNGALYYESANSAQDIVDYLTSKAITLTGSVVGGEIDDPLGSQYIYDDSDVTVKSVGSVPVTTSGIQIDRSNGKVTVKGINLGKGQEIEVHYKVHLNTEDKNFKPDFWYQMNGETTLAPNDSNPTNKVDFGVPSGKAPATKIKVKKVWDEYNKPEKHPDVNFTVGRATTTSDGAWKEATGKLTETTGWEKEFDQLTVDGSDVYLPKFNNEGKDFTYTVKSETQVPGYDIPSIENKDGEWVITNKQKFSPLSLEVTKVSGDNSDLKLAGATFELSGGDLGKTITLTDNGKGTYSLPEGTKLNKDQTYTLTEKTAPAGFEIAPENPWTIKIESTGKVVVTDKDGKEVTSKINQDDPNKPVISLNIADPVKKQEFQVEKYRQGSNDKLDGSEFTLTKYGKDWTDPAGESMTFTGNGVAQNIKPGYYIVKETKAPTGYQLDDTEYKFYIDDHGKMFDAKGKEITKDSLNGKEGFYLTDKGLAFVKYDDLKPFDVQMKKVDKDSNQSIKDVTFITGTKLDGNNVVEEASGTTDNDGLLNYQDKNGATYQFEAGKTYYFQETDATNKYQKLKGYFELVIAADGKKATLTYHNPDGSTNTVEVNISMDKGNVITFTVTNNAKAPLPETGGHGIIGYVAVGLLLMAIAVIGLYANNMYRRRVR